MHTYSINSNERKTIPFFIALLSMGIVFLAKQLITLPDWLPIPSVFAIYGAIYGLFNKFLWKIKLLNSIGLVKTPNLDGEWIMLTKSSLNDFSKEYKGTLSIEQTWTEIKLVFDGDFAISYSVMASINFISETIFSIEWEYLSKKKPQFSTDDYMHYGLTRLQLEKSNKQEMVLKGDYFTDRSRHNYGEIMIKRA